MVNCDAANLTHQQIYPYDKHVRTKLCYSNSRIHVKWFSNADYLKVHALSLHATCRTSV